MIVGFRISGLNLSVSADVESAIDFVTTYVMKLRTSSRSAVKELLQFPDYVYYGDASGADTGGLNFTVTNVELLGTFFKNTSDQKFELPDNLESGVPVYTTLRAGGYLRVTSDALHKILDEFARRNLGEFITDEQVGAILQENGFFLLLETGGKILLE